MLIFILYQIFKGYKNSKLVSGEKKVYPQKSQRIVFALSGLLVAMGLLSHQDKLMSTIMVLMGVAFVVLTLDKTIVGESGIYGKGKYYEWDKLKKWGFNKKTGELQMRVKKATGEEEVHVIPLRPDDMIEVNTLIRKYKLNK